MLFNDVSQFAVLGLLLFAGWLLGFASHSGGKRWRRAYEDETVARAADRDELDGQLREQDRLIKALKAEKAELEGRLGAVAPAAVAAAAPTVADPQPELVAEARPIAHDPAPMVEDARPIAADPAPVIEEARPIAANPDVAEGEGQPAKRGWFDWGVNDDLARLRGVDTDLAGRLKAEGISSFAELGNLSDEQEIALERRLDLPAGYLMKEEVREQARMLAAGQADDHAARFAAA